MHRTAPLPVVVLCLGHGGCVCAQWLTACRHCSGRARGKRKTKSTVGCSTAKRQSLPDFWRALLCPVGERRTLVDSRSRAIVACRFTGNADGSHRQAAPTCAALARSRQYIGVALRLSTGTVLPRFDQVAVLFYPEAFFRRGEYAVSRLSLPTAAALPYG